MNPANAHLAVYLHDHLAGAAAAIAILDSLQEHQDPGLRQFAQVMRAPIVEDRDEQTDDNSRHDDAAGGDRIPDHVQVRTADVEIVPSFVQRHADGRVQDDRDRGDRDHDGGIDGFGMPETAKRFPEDDDGDHHQ